MFNHSNGKIELLKENHLSRKTLCKKSEFIVFDENLQLNKGNKILYLKKKTSRNNMNCIYMELNGNKIYIFSKDSRD